MGEVGGLTGDADLVDLEARVDVDADLVDQLFHDLEVVVILELTDRGEDAVDVVGNAGLDDVAPVGRLVSDLGVQELVEDFLRAASDLDKLVDQIEVLDDDVVVRVLHSTDLSCCRRHPFIGTGLSDLEAQTAALLTARWHHGI